jgi:hypothetical protein
MATSFCQRFSGLLRGSAVLMLVTTMVGGILLAGALAVRPPSASAANVIAINPASGASHAPFTFFLPNSAKCDKPTNQVGGDFLDSFVVSDAKVPAAQVANLTFSGSSGLPHAGSYTGTTLSKQGGSPYANGATLPVTGQVPSPPSFNWGNYADVGDFGDPTSGADLSPGTFNVGIACVTAAGKVEGDNFWNVQVTFAASTTDPGGFTWTMTPFPTTTALSASPAGRAAPGAAVTLQATVSPAGAPGNVTFYNRSEPLGTVPIVVSSSASTATLVTGGLPNGTDSLTAKYVPQVYDSLQLQGVDVYAASTSAPLPYTISAGSTSTTTPANGTTTTTPSGATTTTTPGGGSGSGSGGSAGTGTSGGSGTGGAGSSSAGAGTGGSSSGSGSSTGSGSSDPPLAATGEPIFMEVFVAVLIAVAGLFVLSFAVPTVGRGRTR